MTAASGVQKASVEEGKGERAVRARSAGAASMAGRGAAFANPVDGLQRKAGNRAVSRLMTPSGAATGSVPAGGGIPLPLPFRSEMEARFGEDFDQVRVHEGAEGAAAAAELNAKAYTIGQDIIFAAGRYSPGTFDGRRLLAHELAHVVQQSRGGPRPTLAANATHEQHADAAAREAVSGSGAVAVQGVTGVGAAREPDAPTRLTPREMLAEILKQRGWTNTVPQPPLPPDKRGPRLGDPKGQDTHSLAQVTDKSGKVVAHELGAHLVRHRDIEAAARRDVPRVPGEKGQVHAERMNIGALERRLKDVDVSGGTLEVVVDQLPCGPAEKDCFGGLQEFAQRKGLKLKVYVPTRPSTNNPNVPATPKTAARTAYSGPYDPNASPTGSAQVLQVFPPNEAQGPSPGGGGGPAPEGGPVGGPGPGIGAAPLAPAAEAAETDAALAIETSRLVGQLESETANSVALAGRVKIFAGVASQLLDLFQMFSAASDALSIATNGTILAEAQGQAEKVRAQATAAARDAADIDSGISWFGALGTMEKAKRNRDLDALLQVQGEMEKLADALDEPVLHLKGMRDRLRARADGLNKAARFYEKAAQVPQGPSTAANASEIAMSISLDQLSGTVGNAADEYGKAFATLDGLKRGAEKLASMASGEYRAIALQNLKAELDRRGIGEAQATPPAAPQAHPSPPQYRPPDTSFDRPIVPGPCPGGCHKPNPPPSANTRIPAIGAPLDRKQVADWLASGSADKPPGAGARAGQPPNNAHETPPGVRLPKSKPADEAFYGAPVCHGGCHGQQEKPKFDRSVFGDFGRTDEAAIRRFLGQ
jgi:hypothetical protein